MANFARLHLNQGKYEGRQLLTTESATEMQRTQVDEYQADGRTVGLNFALAHYQGHRRVGHSGGIASFGSLFTLLPDQGVAVVLQFNHSAFWQAGEEIVHHTFDQLLKQSPKFRSVSTAATKCVEPRVDDRERYAGVFLGSRSGLVTIAVAPGENQLLLSRPGKPGETVLRPLREDLFRGKNTQTGSEEVAGFIFSRGGSGEGEISYLILNGAPCVRVRPIPEFVAEPESWQGYIGTYEGPDDTYPSGVDILHITRQGDTLRVHSRNRKREETAIPWNTGCFVYRGMFLQFQKAPDTTRATLLTLGSSVTPYRRITPEE